MLKPEYNLPNHLYHYFASYQEGNVTVYIDGIAQMLKPITSMEDYRRLKEQISSEKADILTVRSLSFLGPVN